ncbi:dehalogenase [Dehalogenimonas sp. THU2]|uniref:dehalogenase n=1 Tax=Dehalogenimonas sp. THU2 TaxID=3151121 RepID=UPI003218D348
MDIFAIMVGLIVGIAVISLVFWLRARKMTLKWYEWLLGSIGLLLLVFTIIIISSSARTIGDPTLARWMMAAVMGLPALVLLAAAWSMVWRRIRGTSS